MTIFKLSKRFLFIIFLFYIFQISVSQLVHPHILVRNEDRSEILKKISEQDWAHKLYGEMVTRVDPYSTRHITDPEWILSRYLMNRVEGKHYTQFISDASGTKLIKYGGNAPHPTVRVSPHKRNPATLSGAGFRTPEIENLIPYDTSMFMNLINIETNEMEFIDPQAFVGAINVKINNLALDAAIVYWLEGEEKYAKFAADILDQWARGAFYQEPIIGPCRTGFLDIQTLGERASVSLVLAYDFVYPYMKAKGYDLHYYEAVFEKIASTIAFRGYSNSNWYAAESSSLVYAALSLENQTSRDYYLKYFLEKDTVNNGCGQLALPSTVEKWLTPDGHWKEPGGYHTYPVSTLLRSTIALEKNGYNVFMQFPALFKASYVMLKYSFPNLTVSAFGDTGRASQSPESLEIGLIGAVKYNQPELPEMLASMKQLIDGGKYSRENSGYLGLLCFLPELPSAESVYKWPRSGTLEFARYFLQRNGTDQKYGLMYGVQGASYNHNHNNGMAMELYGAGAVLGIDAGTGPNYDHPLHVNYYCQWSAHNTVVAAGSSCSVPFNGNAGGKDMGQIELAAMEPGPDEKAMSSQYSFTDTRYYDKSTNTNQMRTMALVRTSEKCGYYIDIYRSDNIISNDYVYHNIGDKLTFLNSDREPLKPVSADYPLNGKDYPGFRYFKEVKQLDNWDENLIALFSAHDEQKNSINMQILIPGQTSRDYYQAMTLKTKTSGHQYSGKDLPVFTMHDDSESKSRPFIAVFEPYTDEDGYSVENISLETRDDTSDFTALTVYNKNNTKQIVFQALDPEKNFASDLWKFAGYFGIIGLKGDEASTFYLGKGKDLTYEAYSIKPVDTLGSVSLVKTEDGYSVSCSNSTEIHLPGNIKSVSLNTGNSNVKLKTVKTARGVSFIIPAVEEGVIRIVLK